MPVPHSAKLCYKGGGGKFNNMIKKKTRARRPRSEPSGQDSMAFPILFVLVYGIIV